MKVLVAEDAWDMLRAWPAQVAVIDWVMEDFLERETSRLLTHGLCDRCYLTVARPATGAEP